MPAAAYGDESDDYTSSDGGDSDNDRGGGLRNSGSSLGSGEAVVGTAGARGRGRSSQFVTITQRVNVPKRGPTRALDISA